jgi:hypothetical protein
MNWTSWIGLPHRFGADPEDGEGADCLIMVWKVLDAAGLHHPELDSQWLEMAKARRWVELQALWQAGTEPAEFQQHAVTLFKNGPAGLGVGVVVDNGLLIVHHRRGVSWVPRSALRPLSYCTFR